jgi:PPOX class probable F420-dependent enzyme
MMDVLDLLARTPYVLLTTFRRDGTPVATPVWVVRDVDELLVWTNPQAGKVKRIRANGRAELAPCSRGGTPLGRSVPATGRVLGPDEIGRVVPALVDKYGVQARLTAQLPQRLSALLRRPAPPVGGLALTLG